MERKLNKPVSGGSYPRYGLPNGAAKAAERKGKPLSIGQRQERSLADRKAPVSLPPMPWAKRETA